MKIWLSTFPLEGCFFFFFWEPLQNSLRHWAGSVRCPWPLPSPPLPSLPSHLSPPPSHPQDGVDYRRRGGGMTLLASAVSPVEFV